jgi:glycosyltransferase involved in cell wall biosynthesis
MRKKLIGIDGRFFAAAGPGRYTKAIIEHLEKVDKENRYIVFLRKSSFDSFEPKNPNFRKVLAEYPWYSWKEQFGFLFKVLSYRLDLLYVPHFNIPVLYSKKIVTAIPDITMHFYSTDAGTSLWKPYFWVKKLVYKMVVPWALLRTKMNIVPSNDVKEDLVTFYPFISKDKYIVAHEGVDPDLLKTSLKTPDVLEKYGIGKKYLLYVSSMSDHKNVDRLVEAFKILREEHGYEGQLVLVGKKDLFSARIEELVKKMGLSEWIIMPGMRNFVSDEEVVALRKGAFAYVFPSLKEGFSLTPLEAQALGIPCIISSIPCHREVYGDTVLYFDPKDANDIAKQVNRVLKNGKLHGELVEKGRENVKKYSWIKTAEITRDVFKKFL